ncbi:MAG TPA: AAA family ATPase [Candidatus Nanoarchaeia archaeon]|nr:AAA family ATPase [Candidatus Nanoarchaeia archaeon]HLD42419.1 AAA family ATPase [Candidatus Nanoarchaeia archaeon]
MPFKVIAITGTPGTGKTTLANKLKSQGYLLLDVPSLIKNFKLAAGYDRKRRCSIINIEGFVKAIGMSIRQIKRIKKDIKGIVIDSHLSHHLPKKLVSQCIVMRCSLKTLVRRLQKKGYSKRKIRENLEAEIFEVCLQEARERGHAIKVITS